MRSKSHMILGQYLAGRYLIHIPQLHTRAFLLGCVQPDRNPLTYLKGSIRHQWFRGHNYPNTRRFIRKLSRRLEKKVYWTALDYYCLGKLIHYTADAFTYAHNKDFPLNLGQHRKYEEQMQTYFLSYLYRSPTMEIPGSCSIMESIGRFHREYRKEAGTIQRDCHYMLLVCCCIFTQLTIPEYST